SVARSSAGFARSTRLSRRSTCSPSSFTTRRELYAGSSRSVKYSLVSSGARLSRLSTRGSERCRTACPAAKLAVSPSAASARPTRPALARPRPTAETRLGECRLRLVVSDDVARLEPEQIVGRAGAARRRDGPGPAVVAGRPDHLVAAGREHGTRAVDVRLVERRIRSEERRVGKECRARRARWHEENKR